MRVVRTNGTRRLWARLRQTGGLKKPAMAAWLRDWLPTLGQTPAAHWLAVCLQSAAGRWALGHWRGLAEIALYMGAYLVYVFSRGAVYENLREVGIYNGGRVADFQQLLGFLWEPGLQAWAIEHLHAAVVFLNYAYILTYWPVILGLAVYLFLRNRREYYYYRTVVLINLVVALITFAVFPVASPFAIPGVGLVDTIQAYGPTIYGNETMSVFYNTTAAMPSLHFSWTVILGVYWFRSLPMGFKVAGLVYPALTFFAITITGNHFVLDAVAGGVLAGLSFGVVEGYRFAAARVSAEDVRASWATLSRKMKQLQIYRNLSRQ